MSAENQRQGSPTTAFSCLAQCDGREAWVAISDLKIVHGKVAAREIVDVLDWAKANRALLATTFEELQR